MSKKQRKRKPRAGSSGQALSEQALEQRARDALAQGHWRDAIAGFKDLLKQDARPDWQGALADAYAGRAEELTAKGMLKEALAIWENRAALQPDLPMAPEHAALLMRLGRPEAVVELLAGGGSALPADQQQRLRAKLAARVLGGDRALLERLPEDDPVRCHAGAASDAFAAYCDADDDALRTALSLIPFRSPYRDWAQLLKALIRLAEAPAEAQALLARVDDDSPFAPLKRAALLSLGPERALLAADRTVSEPALRIACALRGWSPARVAVLQEMRSLGDVPSPKALIRLLYRHAKVIGPDWARRMALALVAQAGPEAIHWLREAGAARPSRWEQALVAAWKAEQGQDGWAIQWNWRTCAELLESSKTGAEDPDRNLRIALLLRRADVAMDLLGEAKRDGDLYELTYAAGEDLEDSLRWDPDDQPTYLRLIGWYRHIKDLKSARRLLEQAQGRWPEAMPVLEAAMDIALDGGAFKKAAGIARRILAIDPINSGVRRRLVDAHLAHARKQVFKPRFDLARTELADALGWARDEPIRERIRLSLALLGLVEGDEVATGDLRARFGGTSSALRDRIELMLAADGMRMSPDFLKRQLDLKKPKVAGRDDLLASLSRLRAALDHSEQVSNVTDQMLSEALTKGPWRALSRTELETACDTVARWQLDKVRERAATEALKQWPGEPIFELHRFEGKYPKGFDYRQMGDLDRLEAALARARADGDMRTATRIERLVPLVPRIGRLPGAFPPISVLMDDDEDDFDDIGLGEADEQLDELLDAARILGLERALEAMGAPREVIRTAKEMERELGPKGALEMFSIFVEQIGGLDLPGGLPSPPRPPPRRKQSKPAKKPAAPEPRDDDDEDDDRPEQLELF